MISIDKIAHLINGEIEGNPELTITGACNLKQGKENCISFLGNPKYTQYLEGTQASVIIVEKDLNLPINGKTLIRVDNPNLAFAKVLEELMLKPSVKTGIHKTASIDKTANINSNTAIGANVVIEKNVKVEKDSIISAGTFLGENSVIGKNCEIQPNVTIYPQCEIGDNVHIDSGTVIGADGFGWTTDEKNHHKIPQIGKVVIENDVWIGANCCIDRATFDKTVIGSGTKMDNLIQIAHNVIIGKNCLIAGAVAIAGSTKIGNWVTIAGQVGIIDHMTIGDRTIIASKSAVYKSVPEGSFISGIPARKHSDRLKQDIALTQLPELQKRVRKIEQLLVNKKD